MSANPVLWDLDQRGVATVTLNRPEVNNAYDAGLINGVLAAMDDLGKPKYQRKDRQCLPIPCCGTLVKAASRRSR